MSGSGKSTLAHAVEEQLYQNGMHTFVLDGDNIRHGLCADIGFSAADRVENIRRIGELAKLFMESGIIVLTAFISPYRSDRRKVRELVKDCDFIEIYCQCTLEVCEQRDVKGLYKKARAGEIPNFTGISAPYETPEAPELILDTAKYTVEQCTDRIISALQKAISLDEKQGDNNETSPLLADSVGK